MLRRSRALAGLPSGALFVLVIAGIAMTMVRSALPPPAAAGSAVCLGDCDGGGSVTVDEILTLANIALGTADLNTCENGNANQDDQITVDEILAAASNAFDGCMEVEPTPTPTPLDQPSIARRAAGTIEASTAAVLAIGDVVSVLLNPTGFGARTAGGIAFPLACPAGGSGTVMCTQDLIALPPGPPSYTLQLDKCRVNRPGDSHVTFDGTIIAAGPSGDFCFVSLPASLALAIDHLSITAEGGEGTTTTTFTNLTASAALSGTDPHCTYKNAAFELMGDVEAESRDAAGTLLVTTHGTFSNTSLTLAVEQYDSTCAPLVYTMTANGNVIFTGGDISFTEDYEDLVLHNDATSGQNVIEVSGRTSSQCFGATLQFNTVTPLQVTRTEPCPRAGEVRLSYSDLEDLLRYTATQGVEIDYGADDSVDQQFTNCLDERLFVCPAR